MLRDIDLQEVSDGRLYTNNDMVRADCGGCHGCFDCCRGMGSSIILDPFDIYRMCAGLGLSFEELLADAVELNIVDGIVLPNLKMNGKDETCFFLNEEGRCSIHPHRPGICRLFPLGRFYENHSFQYFLQVHECPKPDKAKIKIRKWLDTPNLKQYEAYICNWHYYLRGLMEQILSASAGGDIAETVKSRSMHVLRTFYLLPYDTEREFYEQFYERLGRDNNL